MLLVLRALRATARRSLQRLERLQVWLVCRRRARFIFISAAWSLIDFHYESKRSWSLMSCLEHAYIEPHACYA